MGYLQQSFSFYWFGLDLASDDQIFAEMILWLEDTLSKEEYIY